MRTDLAYIDTVIDREVTARHENASHFSEGEREKANKAGDRFVAGFAVHDEEEEKKYLDNLIATRRKAIDAFIDDRASIRTKLKAKDITPLAVVPASAWTAICDTAKLFRLSPHPASSGLHIDVSSLRYAKFILEDKKTKKNMFGGKFEAKSYRADSASPAEVNAWASQDWEAFLRLCFGGLVALPGSSVALRLPTPPADVAKTLLKAKGLDLKVAAVADAIAFDKTPYEIVRQAAADLEAAARRQEMHDADPIVYCEEGNVAAIIAQFGDFPIEKAVVDAVVASDDLIKAKPTQIDYAGMITMVDHNDLYRAAMQQSLLQQQMYQQQALANTFNGSFTNTNSVWSSTSNIFGN